MGLRTIIADQYKVYTVHSLDAFGCILLEKYYRANRFSEKTGVEDRSILKKLKLDKQKEQIVSFKVTKDRDRTMFLMCYHWVIFSYIHG